ncbi:MAG: hypothetical protein PHW64_06965 [Sulfuricurvum sp.]|nr:hypothetical protein [Sulfuricurvum sp.]
MFELIREAQSKFQEIAALLNSPEKQTDLYFTQLGELTAQAYVLMNEGMCESTTVCHECAKHRDFLYTVLPVIESLRENSDVTASVTEHLAQYRVMVNEVLSRISAVLSER